MTPAERSKRQEMIKRHRSFMEDKNKKRSDLKEKAKAKVRL